MAFADDLAPKTDPEIALVPKYVPVTMKFQSNRLEQVDLGHRDKEIKIHYHVRSDYVDFPSET